MDVSIIIPYNVDRGWLDNALNSASNQQFSGEFQVIISHSEHLLGVNINAGIESASGKYIKILAEDDLLPPDSIQLLFDFCEENELDWAFSNAINFGNDPKSGVPVKSSPDNFKNNNAIHGGTAIYKRSVLIDTGGFDEKLWTAEEYDLHLRLKHLGYKYGYLDATTYFYRTHKACKSYRYRKQSTAKDKKTRSALIEAIKKKYEN